MMNQFWQFAILGLGTGALYAFAAQGLVLVYKATGVLNFANGAIGIADAFVFWELRNYRGWSFAAAFAAAVALAFIFGILWHFAVMRQLRHRSGLVRVVATLGLLAALQGVAGTIYHTNVFLVPTTIPARPWHIGSSIVVSSDRVYLFIMVVLLIAILWAIYRFTPFGIATTAVSENIRAAASLGLSFDRVAALNWGLSCALVSAASIFLVPIIALSTANMTALLLSTLAAALIGNFRSFWLTLVGGLALGVLQGELGYYSASWGSWSTGLVASVPFFLIVMMLVLRGRSLPLRDFFQHTNPMVGSGRIRPKVAGVSFAALFALSALVDANWANALATTFSAAVVLLSLVVVLGYAGQLSIAQAAFAGFGCYIAAELVANVHLSFVLALIIGAAATIPVGVLFGLPALRTRGINLAIVTLGLGSALEFMLFDNPAYTSTSGIVVGAPTLFGWDIDAINHPERWACFCLVVLALCMLAVSNIRRGSTGRRLLAVRANERAAAALGINVLTAKLYAFAVAAGIAAIGGVLTYFAQPVVIMNTISNSASPADVSQAAIGGIGYIAGPLLGGQLAVGGIGQLVTSEIISPTIGNYLSTFSGVFLILILLQSPNGMAELNIRTWQRLARSKRSIITKHFFRTEVADTQIDLQAAGQRQRVTPRELEIVNVTVRYGQVVACDEISLTVRPGQIVGLIGPNGAGKTTLIDAIAGFTRPSAGAVWYGGTDITQWSAVKRARAGISRTFQSLELYDDMTVIDNMRAAFEIHRMSSGLTDIVWPKRQAVSATAAAAVQEFQLADDLELRVDSLPYGRRRLLAAARAVAASPSVLLLDECAAGLSEAETQELGVLVRRLADSWGMGILVIEHDMNFVMSVCDQLVVLDFGKKIADGPVDEVRADPAVVAAYLGAPEIDLPLHASGSDEAVSSGAAAPNVVAEGVRDTEG